MLHNCHFRTALAAALLALIVVLTAGCSGERDQPPADNRPDGGTLVVGLDADADALSPLVTTTSSGSDIFGEMFCGLARTNPDMASYSPWLAESWEFSPDHKTLTFHLRDDVLWHDGVKFSAYDVEFSVPLYQSERIAYGSIRWLEKITAVTALDSFTVRFEFDAVYPYQLTDANVGRPLPKHLLEEVPHDQMRNHPFHREPVGNGPFMFESWTAQQSIVIVANDLYFEGRPHLDRVVFQIIPSRTNLIAQLKRGEIDFYPKLPPHAYKEISETEGIDVRRVPSRVYYYLGWQNTNPLFTDMRVRRALTMSINRESIVQTLLFGTGEVIHGPILPFLWAHEPDLEAIPYDPEGAKALFAEAGWTDSDGDGWLDRGGEPFEFRMKTNENNSLRKDIVVIVQEMLSRVGVKVHPETVEWTLFLEQTTGKDFEASCHGWRQGIKVDLTSIWHSRSIDDRYNMVSYSNEDVDRLIDEAVLELDREKARGMWREVQRIIAEEVPYTFLFNVDDLYAIDGRFENVELLTYSWTYNLEEWSVPPGKRKYQVAAATGQPGSPRSGSNPGNDN